MRKPLGKNEVKRIARIWLSSITSFYVSDLSENMVNGNASEDELRAIYEEIERIGDRIIGCDVQRSNLHEAIEDVLNDRK